MTMMWTRTIVSKSGCSTALKHISSSAQLTFQQSNLRCFSCLLVNNNLSSAARSSGHSFDCQRSCRFTNQQAFFSSPSDPSNNQNETAKKSSERECNDHVPDTTFDQDGTSITIPGAQKGGRKLAIVFTCTVCDTRSAKQFTEQAYLHGVVIVRCPGCQNLHLIADRLGYFQDGDWDLDSIMAKTGQTVKTISESDVFEVRLEDLVGKERMEELLKESEASTGK